MFCLDFSRTALSEPDFTCSLSPLWEPAEAAGAVSDQANVSESLAVRTVGEERGVLTRFLD